MKFVPHKYQEYAIERGKTDPALLLLLEMGLGKTVIMLTVLQYLLYDSFEARRVLIVAPKRVAEDTWSRESSKWGHLQGLVISKVLGSAKQREKALQADADLYITNRENVQWLVQHYGKKWPFDCVVIDEISSFKSSSSQRFRALKAIRPRIKRIYGLTGTPAPNSLLDLWPQMYLIDEGERLGKTIGGYREKYFVAGAKSGHVVYEWKQKTEAEKRIYEAIADVAISMKAEDWLDMPARIDNVITVRMSEKETALYKKLERELLLPFTEGDVVAQTAAVLSNKLLQMSNGAIYNENRGVQHIHDGKLDALEEIIEGANGHPVLLFYAYKHDLARIRDRFPQVRTLDSPDDIAEWNAGRINLLATHPKSAGHGLNLQDGGSRVVWFGMTWSLEEYQQANARLYRQGQMRSVIVDHIITEGTLDEDVMDALERKATGQDALMSAVKARIDKV